MASFRRVHPRTVAEQAWSRATAQRSAGTHTARATEAGLASPTDAHLSLASSATGGVVGRGVVATADQQ